MGGGIDYVKGSESGGVVKNEDRKQHNKVSCVLACGRRYIYIQESRLGIHGHIGQIKERRRKYVQSHFIRREKESWVIMLTSCIV